MFVTFRYSYVVTSWQAEGTDASAALYGVGLPQPTSILCSLSGLL